MMGGGGRKSLWAVSHILFLTACALAYGVPVTTVDGFGQGAFGAGD